MTSTVAPPVVDGKVLFAKAGPDGKSMGDCPFTQKANLALRFKGANFETYFIDLANKPEWFLEISNSVPVLMETGKDAVDDSDMIVKYADECGSVKDFVLTRSDDPRWDEAVKVAKSVLPALGGFLKNKDPAKDPELSGALADALRGVDSFFASGGGPFMLGDKVSAADCIVAPVLNHTMVAATHYKGFKIPVECTQVINFMDKMRSSEEWQATACPDEVILWGWGKFFN